MAMISGRSAATGRPHSVDCTRPWCLVARGSSVWGPPLRAERRETRGGGLEARRTLALRPLTLGDLFGVVVVIGHIAFVAPGQHVQRVLHVLAVGLVAQLHLAALERRGGAARPGLK